MSVKTQIVKSVRLVFILFLVIEKSKENGFFFFPSELMSVLYEEWMCMNGPVINSIVMSSKQGTISLHSWEAIFYVCFLLTMVLLKVGC